MADVRRSPSGPQVVGAVAAVVALAAAGVTALVLRDSGAEPDPVGDLTATPVAPATTAAATAPAASAPAASAPSPVPSAQAPGPAPTAVAPAPAPSSGAPATAPAPAPAGTPADGDAAAAAQAITPEAATDARTVLADLDSDGVTEVVVASLVADRSRIDVARWDGTAFGRTFTGEGGAAEALEAVVVEDLDGTPGTREVVVRQTSGDQGRSASLWGLRDGAVVPLTAVDGCWDGSHTYGVVGVEVAVQRIVATCDGSPAPIAAWPSDVYVWEPALEAFAYERTVQPGASE